MYEFLILAQLSRRPMHGYMIAKIIGNIMGPFRQAQWGALYPVLNRLMQEGLIRAEEDEVCEDGRSRKVYAITDTGMARLHEHLLDTEHHLGEYDTVFAQKVVFFHLLSREERLYLVRHYVVYAQQHIAHLERKCQELEAFPVPPEQKPGILAVMRHRRRYWEQERAWAEELIKDQRLQEVS
ncbi:MAG TPA: PadR family transcriptional regulator [Chloroflexota bacterium]|nr:PadR family transcriptional regulator [Chloroflexota bacterium]